MWMLFCLILLSSAILAVETTPECHDEPDSSPRFCGCFPSRCKKSKEGERRQSPPTHDGGLKAKKPERKASLNNEKLTDLSLRGKEGERNGIPDEGELTSPWLVSLGWQERGRYYHKCTGALLDLPGVLEGVVVVTSARCFIDIEHGVHVAKFQYGKLITLHPPGVKTSYKSDDREVGNFALVLLTEKAPYKGISWPKDVAEAVGKAKAAKYTSFKERPEIGKEGKPMKAFTAQWVLPAYGRIDYMAIQAMAVHKVVIVPSNQCSRRGTSGLFDGAGLCAEKHPFVARALTPYWAGVPIYVKAGNEDVLLGLFTDYVTGTGAVYFNLRYNPGRFAIMMNQLTEFVKEKRRYAPPDPSSSNWDET